MGLPIEVVFLLQDLCFGGTQRQTLELARRLDRTRFSPAIWTLSGPTDLDAVAEEAGIPVAHLGNTAFPGPGFPLALLKQLFADGPDVLVPCTALPNIWGRILGRLRRVPLIVGTCRGGGAPARQHEAYLWRLAHHMICNSMPLYHILCNLGMPSGRVTYIPNGVDTEFFVPGETPLRERGPEVLCVGRLASDKDHMTLLRAFGRVLSAIPNARLRIVGDGPQEFTLRKFIEGPPFKKRVEILPATTDTRMYYQSAQVFALTSVREGQPNVILEAMASGLPVVATDVGGIPTLVRDGETGLLAPCGDSVTLGDHIRRLLESPGYGEGMGLLGRQCAEREFAFDAMVETHAKLFERLWALRTGGGGV